jgi:hypothetical protein
MPKSGQAATSTGLPSQRVPCELRKSRDFLTVMPYFPSYKAAFFNFLMKNVAIRQIFAHAKRRNSVNHTQQLQRNTQNSHEF